MLSNYYYCYFLPSVGVPEGGKNVIIIVIIIIVIKTKNRNSGSLSSGGARILEQGLQQDLK